MSNSEFVQVSSPFEDMSESDLARVRTTMRSEADKAFAEATEMLQRLVATTPSLRILGDLGFHFYLDQDGFSSGKDYAIEQHHVEYAQALTLRAPVVTGGADPYAGPAINEMILALRGQTSASSMRRWPPDDAEASELARFEVIDSIRRFTEDVRGDFNTFQFDRYMAGVLSRIDARFEAVHGIPATALLAALRKLLELIEAKLLAFQKAAGRLRHAKRGGKAIATYLRSFPASAADRELIIANVKERKVPNDQLGQYLFGQAYNHLPAAFTFSADELAAAVGEDHAQAAINAMRRWSLAFGDLADRDAERLLTDNPVWSRPFVAIGNRHWMWPSPGTLFSSGINMFELLIDDDAKLKEAYSEARAVFLEEETARLLREHLPSAKVWTSVKWRDPTNSTPYEADVVARIDDTLLVVEAKSGQLNDAARRGADASLKREIRKLMIDPAVQSKRFVDHVRSSAFEGTLACVEGECNLEIAQVRQVVRLTVAFETPGPLATAWNKLVDAKIVPADVEHAPVLGLSDLEVMLDLMGDEASILHYLLRRTSFERTADFFADEHDLIAFYLRGGFNIAEAEEGRICLNVYGMSDMLRPYYSRTAGEKRVKKPKLSRSQLFSCWINELCRRKPERWVTMASMLLDVDHASQQGLDFQLRERAMEVAASGNGRAYRATVIPTGPEHRRAAIVSIVYRGLEPEEVASLVENLYVHARVKVGTDRVLVIGMDITKPQPYSVIGFRD